MKLTVDHVVPEALGGSDDPSNLVTACEDCNGGKSAIPPDAALVADVAQDALRWRKAMEVAHEMAAREYADRSAFCAEFADQWANWTWTDRMGVAHEIALPSNWEVRVGELMAAGLSVLDMRDAVDASLSAKWVKDEFAYFVSVARSRIATRQAVAAELLRQGLVGRPAPAQEGTLNP